MQQATLLKAVVAHVFMLVVNHGPARQQRVAMFAVACKSIAAVHRLVALGGQIVGLRQVGPAGKVTSFFAVHAAHLLQANNISVKLFYRVHHVVNFQPPAGAQAAHTLVNIPGSNT